MSLSDTLKDHVVVVVSGVAIASFGAGWAAYKAVVDAQGQELILKTQRMDLERRASELEACRSAGTAKAPVGSATCSDQLAEALKARPRFEAGQWRYLSMPNATGVEVAHRLTAIAPPEDGVVVSYDGSANNTFHIWYRGQGSSTKYSYSYGVSSDLADPPSKNYFLAQPGLVPAGIGGAGNAAVPIYFIATR